MKLNVAERLLEKYAEGNCRPDEAMLVELWFESLEPNLVAADALERARISAKMKLHIDRAAGRRPGNYKLFRSLAVAASIAVLIGLAFYLLKPVPQMSAKLIAFAKQVKPGRQQAYLTLANGKRMVLNDLGTGVVAAENGVQIRKTTAGELIYEICKACQPQGNSPAKGFNTIETPRGGQYQLRLPDGTMVWLNAGSTFKYPLNFGGNKRSVELSGEAYFEVAKDPRHPFVVQSKLQEVEVLGTHFNISSYYNEASVKTTLLEGAVKVRSLPALNETAGKSATLKPGQQSILIKDQLKVEQIDMEDAMGWKQGLFIFNEDPLVEVMHKISRWYDVDITFADPSLKNTRFSGSISRNLSLLKVLEKLSVTGGIRFSLEQRSIIIREK